MHTFAVVEEGAATGIEIDSVEILANVSALVGAQDDATFCSVETEEF